MWLIGKKNYNNLEDQDLIAAYRKKGDKKAVGVLFERYSHLVYGVCMKYLKNQDDSKDATLNIFEKLMGDLKKYEVQKFSYWIHSVARNYCLMQLRSRKAMYYVDDEKGPGIDAYMESHYQDQTTEADNTEQQLVLLEEAINHLNTEQRICVELFYLKKYCYQDVAEIAGFTLLEVKSFIQNGKRNLKIYMLKKNHEQSAK
ncbi:MAG: sigma-70 family RNA polymerase sigma factor [Bacteroidetes bacterium]|nr:sigma-70 family RNA polymerase sigma factor [Bacteroidota bacterium]